MNTDKSQEKKREKARRAVKLWPVALLGFTALLVVHLARSAGHWRMEETLRTASDLGLILFGFSGWLEARYTLRGEEKTPFPMLPDLAMMLMFSGLILPDFYHGKDLLFLFYLFGVLLAYGVLLILVRIVLEAMTLRKRRRTRPGRE